ncbi:MAG: hypothetical protein ACTSV5_01575 [Promethearchaeota archaeon]
MFQNEIQFKWEEFKLQNKTRVIKKTYTTFFYLHFNEFFQNFLEKFCGFDSNSLGLIIKEKVSEDNLFLEYNYKMSSEEARSFKEFGQNYGDIINGITTPTGYLYIVVSILGVILRKLLKEPFYVILDGAVLREEEDNNVLNFLIVIKDSKDNLFEYYYSMFLYYFLKHFKGIPESYYGKLLLGRKKLYNLAIKKYPLAKEKLVDLLYYFYKKCNLLHNFSPLLDFINFVCARVEDSIYSKIDVIKEQFLVNFDYSEGKKNSIIKIFDFLDKKSTLYSTFQSNNLPSSKAQFNLFLLYLKVYFGSGSKEAFGEEGLLFLPEKFELALNHYNEHHKNKIDEKAFIRVQKFIENSSILSSINNIDILFEKIFNSHLTSINYTFFKTFLHSLNSKLANLIENENKIISEKYNDEPFTFKDIVDHICRMLYTLIDQIFIRLSPNQASKNFIDPRSRYIGKNIALRVLELFIFQDLNVSDDVWPDYVISMNKDELKGDMKSFGVDLPERYFYNVEDILRFIVTYNFQSYSDKNLLEEWFVNEIIAPLNEFILMIRKSVKDLKNKDDIYKSLNDFFLIDISPENKTITKEFKFVCNLLIPIWLEN